MSLVLLIRCLPFVLLASVEALADRAPSIVVEPFPFVATITPTEHRELCYPTMDDLRTPCGGMEKSFLFPDEEGFLTKRETYIIGPKYFPRVGPSQISAMLVSSLKSGTNLRIVESRKAAPSTEPAYVVKGTLTEYNGEAETHETGGISAWRLIVHASDSKKVIATVRVDIVVTNLRTKQIVDSFSVSGSAEHRAFTSTYANSLVGYKGVMNYTSETVSSALRDAFTNAVSRIERSIHENTAAN